MQLLDLQSLELLSAFLMKYFLQRCTKYTLRSQNSQKMDRVSRWLLKRVEVMHGECIKELKPLKGFITLRVMVFFQCTYARRSCSYTQHISLNPHIQFPAHAQRRGLSYAKYRKNFRKFNFKKKKNTCKN